MIDMNVVNQPFPPVVDSECSILILGSFPSVKSRADGFFYGHPRNRFWPLLSVILDEQQPITIAEKKAMLLRHHIALWDVIASCEISGSSDASVKNAQPIDISRITNTAHIKYVICNGSLSGKLYNLHLKHRLNIEPIVLPSTSPANATFSLDKLIAIWREALHAII